MYCHAAMIPRPCGNEQILICVFGQFNKLSRAFLQRMVKIFGWTARLNADLQYPPYKGSQDLPRTYNEATRDDLVASRLME